MVLMFISALLQGCVHLPSSKPELPPLPVPGIRGILTNNPTHSAIQTAVNWQAALCIIGGAACLAFGGLSIYGGQIVPGIKLILAGALLPIFAIWWKMHWLLAVCLILIGGACYWLLLHWAYLRPALVKLEGWAKTVESRIPPAPTHPATTVHS